jgi:hypothetical protein
MNIEIQPSIQNNFPINPPMPVIQNNILTNNERV